MSMQIVIPMSGLGSRFASEGYKDIKPLIKVMGKPMVEWVCDLFPGEDDFLFICREEHLLHTNLREELNRIRPHAVIAAIPGHKKGPVHAVNLVAEHIRENSQVIVNYCDFFMNWDYQDFKEHVNKNEVQGSIPCYTGFHPHLLNKENKYAVCKLGVDGFLQEIKEKHRYNENPEDNYHSAGTYYFSSGSLVKEVFRELEKRTDLQLNGEWYVSLVYILMLEREMKISVYDRIRHFCQWGTPEDMEEYMAWANIFEIQHYGE